MSLVLAVHRNGSTWQRHDAPARCVPADADAAAAAEAQLVSDFYVPALRLIHKFTGRSV